MVTDALIVLDSNFVLGNKSSFIFMFLFFREPLSLNFLLKKVLRNVLMLRKVKKDCSLTEDKFMQLLLFKRRMPKKIKKKRKKKILKITEIYILLEKV